MIDTRLTWLYYLSPNPEKTLIDVQKGLDNLAIKTLQETFNRKGVNHVLFRQCNDETVVPRTFLLPKQLDCDIYLRLFKSRNKTESIGLLLTDNSDFEVCEYSVFPNWENPRWCIPINRSLRPGKMSRMIQPSKLFSRAVTFIYRMLKVCNCDHYVFTSRLVVAHKKHNTLNDFFGCFGPDVKTGIVYTGSFGPLQKFTVELTTGDDVPFGYAKFGHSEYAITAIQNEQQAFDRLSGVCLEKVVVPELLEAQLPAFLKNKTLIVKSLDGGKALRKIDNIVISGLAELYSSTKVISGITVKKYISDLIGSLQEIDCTLLGAEYCEVKGEVSSILDCVSNYYSSTLICPLSLSHGDFTRWNVRADNSKIFVIDWEEAALRPPGHDLLSFLMAEYLLVKNLGPLKTSRLITRDINKGVLNLYLNKINWKMQMQQSHLGILFLASTLRQNLWHATFHSALKYPVKSNLQKYVTTTQLTIDSLIGENCIEI